MTKYTQDEKDFRLELGNLLNKWGATISVVETDVSDYKDIPNFGTIYKKAIEIEIPHIKGVSENTREQVVITSIEPITGDNIFNVHLQP